MKKLNDKSITLRIELDQLDEVIRYADKMKMNRSQLLRNLIECGLEDYRLLDKIGFLSLAIKGRNLMHVVRASIEDDRFEVEGDKLVIDL